MTGDLECGQRRYAVNEGCLVLPMDEVSHVVATCSDLYLGRDQKYSLFLRTVLSSAEKELCCGEASAATYTFRMETSRNVFLQKDLAEPFLICSAL